MARKSVEALTTAAELEAVSARGALSVITGLPGARSEPPPGLNEETAEVWRSIVSSKPHDWFTADTCYLLEAYCHAVISHRLVSVGVSGFDAEKLSDPKNLAIYDSMTRMQERQARVMATIATKLRLTNQSRYTPQAANTAAKKAGGRGGSRPWDS